VGYTKTGILDGKVLLSFEFVSKCWAAVMMQVDYETLNLRRLNYGCGFVSCVYEMSKMLMGFSNSLFCLSITTGRLNEKVLLSYAFVSTCYVLVVMQLISEVFYLLRWLCGTDIAYGVLIFKKKSNTLGLRFVLTLSRGDLLQLSWKDHYSSWLCELNPQGISCDEYWLNGAYGFCNIKGATICKCWHGFEPMFLHEWKMVEWFDGCVKKHWQLCRDGDLFKHFTRITLPHIASNLKCIQVYLLCIQQHLKLITNEISIPVKEVSNNCWNGEAHICIFYLALEYGYTIIVTKKIVLYGYSIVLFKVLIGKHIHALWQQRSQEPHSQSQLAIVVDLDKCENATLFNIGKASKTIVIFIDLEDKIIFKGVGNDMDPCCVGS
jgi:hypothetical protein